MSDLSSARAYLRAPGGDPSGVSPSLHAHLSALLQSLIRDRHPQPLARFEEISVQIKQQRAKEKGADGSAGGLAGLDGPVPVGGAAAVSAALVHLQRQIDLIKPPKKLNDDGEEEDEEELEANPAAPDMQEQAFMCQQTGRRTKPAQTPHRPTISRRTGSAAQRSAVPAVAPHF